MRASIGLFAILLLAIGIAARLQPEESLYGAGGASLRVGVVMAVWWLAYPQAKRVPLWLSVACAITLFVVLLRPKLILVAIPLFVVLLRPKLILVAIPLLAVLWFLGPRSRSRESGG